LRHFSTSTIHARVGRAVPSDRLTNPGVGGYVCGMILVAIACLLGCISLAWGVDRALARLEIALRGAIETLHGADVLSRLVELEGAIDALPARWKEFADHAKRSEQRVRAAIKSARQELEDGGLSHPAIEAEAVEAGMADGNGGGDVGVQSVRRAMASPATPAQPPDWNAATLARKYGLR